jgi:RNA polymerase sigma factor (sigma-70 family)
MTNVQINDTELVIEFRNGNDKAFETLLRRHKTKVYNTIYLIVKDADVAQDLLQDCFIKAVDHIRLGKYNEEGKFLQWILRMAHNIAIDNFRRNKRYPSIVLEDGMSMLNSFSYAEESIEQLKIKEETHASLRQMIQELPDVQREVLVMRHYGDMSFQEIAEATGVSINTALGRMRYALINLRKQFEQSNVAYEQNIYS